MARTGSEEGDAPGRRSRRPHSHFRGPNAWHRPHGGGFGQIERGVLKYDVLAILAEGPRHGYEIMGAIEAQRGFRPSPGSIYPALQMLHDGDFLESREVDGKRIYSISESGLALLATYRASPEGMEEPGPPSSGMELMLRGKRTLHGLREALKQIARSGDVARVVRAVEILSRARRELYALLAEDE